MSFVKGVNLIDEVYFILFDIFGNFLVYKIFFLLGLKCVL